MWMLGLGGLIWTGCNKPQADPVSPGSTDTLDTADGTDTGSGTGNGSSTEHMDAFLSEIEVPYDTSGARTTMWKVLLVKSTDGSISFEQKTSVDILDEMGAPPSNPAGAHLLEAYSDAGEALAYFQIDFPTEGIEEDFEGDSTVVDLEGEEVFAVAYFEAAEPIHRLVLLDEDLNTVVESELDLITEVDAEDRKSSTASACSHIGISQNFFPWVGAPAQAEALTQRVVDSLPPVLCQSVDHITFREGGSGGETKGRDVYVNILKLDPDGELLFSEERLLEEDPMARTMLTWVVVHEFGHALHNLLVESNPSYLERMTDVFPGIPPSDLEVLQDHLRLHKGLRQEWYEIHTRSHAEGYACKHSKNLVIDQPEYTATCGWMSAYGGNDNYCEIRVDEDGVEGCYEVDSYKDVGDDIAEMLAWPIVGHLFYSQGVTYPSPAVGALPADYACQQLAGASLSDDNVTILAKLALLRDIGAISESEHDACTDGVTLEADGQSPGFHLYQDDVLQRSFTDDVSAGLQIHNDDYRTFYVRASGTSSFGGEEFPTDLELTTYMGRASVEIDKVSWPRGVYASSNETNFTLTQEDNSSGSWYAVNGKTFVHSATNDRIIGKTVISVVYEGLTPETYDPPLHINFVLEN